MKMTSRLNQEYIKGIQYEIPQSFKLTNRINYLAIKNEVVNKKLRVYMNAIQRKTLSQRSQNSQQIQKENCTFRIMTKSNGKRSQQRIVNRSIFNEKRQNIKLGQINGLNINKKSKYKQVKQVQLDNVNRNKQKRYQLSKCPLNKGVNELQSLKRGRRFLDISKYIKNENMLTKQKKNMMIKKRENNFMIQQQQDDGICDNLKQININKNNNKLLVNNRCDVNNIGGQKYKLIQIKKKLLQQQQKQLIQYQKCVLYKQRLLQTIKHNQSSIIKHQQINISIQNDKNK